MAKTKKITQEVKDIILGDGSPYIIKEAAIKDDFCHYTFEITQGIGNGDAHTVKGSNIIKEDMRKAFERLHVHIACIDDVFKHSNVNIDDIDTMHNDELTEMYHVSGIKIKGNGDNESVILIGNKYISCSGGRVEIVTPKITLDKMSSYKWYNELKDVTDAIRHEVRLYKEGKYEKVIEEDETPGAVQMKITDMSNDNDDFENNKV